MLEIMQSLTDDQMAVLGCFGALSGATMMLMVSYHLNPQNRQSEKNQELRVQETAVKSESESSTRRAA